MKTVSSDGRFIDYTTKLFGVRVRESFCRTISRTELGWEEYGGETELPVSASRLDPSRTDDLGDLLINVVDYETCASEEGYEDKTELRKVLLGSLAFATATRIKSIGIAG